MMTADSPPADSEAAGVEGHLSAVTHSRGATTPAAVRAPDGGHERDALPSSLAPVRHVQRARNGQTEGGPRSHAADLATLHALLGHYARLYWDLQAARIAVGNRAGALERAHLAPLYQAVPVGRQGVTEPVSVQSIADGLEALEHGLVLTLQRLVRQHFMRDWVEAQRGLDLLGFAALVGVTGDLMRFPSVAKLWKYLGLHVQDGHAPQREKGVPWTHTDCQFRHLAGCKPGCITNHHAKCVPGGVGTAYSPKGRVICKQLAQSIVQSKPVPSKKYPDRPLPPPGPYRAAYERKKAEYEAERPDWTQARRHNAAMRYAVKLLVKELWLEWRRRVRASAA